MGEEVYDEEVCGTGDDEQAQRPSGLPGPKTPSAAEIDLHNLTHMPYRSWCPHCVAGRRPNTQHHKSDSQSSIPSLVADYCFLRDAQDQDLTTVLVAKVYPFKMTMVVAMTKTGSLSNSFVSVFKGAKREIEKKAKMRRR